MLQQEKKQFRVCKCFLILQPELLKNINISQISEEQFFYIFLFIQASLHIVRCVEEECP